MLSEDKVLTAKKRKLLLDSLEVAHIRHICILYTVLFALAILIALFRLGDLNDTDLWLAIGAIFAMVMLPILGFYLIRLIRIFRKADQYCFCRTKLDRPHHSHLVRAYYFTVFIRDSEGREFPADTHAIFQTYGLVGPVMEDCLNCTVWIAYNEATGMVVVIG